MSAPVAGDLGRLFEVGFNLGIYYQLKVSGIPCASLPIHGRHLSRHNTRWLITEFVRRQGATSAEDDDLLTRIGTLHLWKGFLAGRDVLQEFCTAARGGRVQDIDVPFYLCSFVGKNAFVEDDLARRADEVLAREHLGILLKDGASVAAASARYRGTGEFLQADALVLLRTGAGTRQEAHHLLCVDLSVLSVQAVDQLPDIRHAEVVQQVLAARLRQFRAKSVFSSLSLDTGEETRRGILAGDFERYLRAFLRDDRESIKAVQAASYASSFHRFLTEHGLFQSAQGLRCTALGHSDRGAAAMSGRLGGPMPDDSQLFSACSRIYKQYRARATESRGAQEGHEALRRERDDVLAVIQRNARRMFATGAAAESGRAFVDALAAVRVAESDAMVAHVTHRECLDRFTNSIDLVPETLLKGLDLPDGLSLRDGHRLLVERAMAEETPYVFLTGNPGIGKTTALARYLQREARAGNGFLLLYTSPRTQVNLDIFDKFNEDGVPFDERFIGLTSNAHLIKGNNGRHTVQYLARDATQPFTLDGVEFWDGATATGSAHARRATGVRRVSESEVTDSAGTVRGVLDSISRGIAALLRQGDYRYIAAAVAIQSYKQLASGAETLEHLLGIFKDCCSQGEPIPERMRSLAARLPIIVVMIDEVTGDAAGPALLHGMIALFRRLRLDDFGFRLKLVVADASIVGPEIIASHLAKASPEPHKIFFRKTHGVLSATALSYQPFAFKSKGKPDAVVVNANSFPARSLQVTYHVFIEPIYMTEQRVGQQGRKKRDDADVRDHAGEQLVMDICGFLQRTREDKQQAIVYIQDKARLQEIIGEVAEHEDSVGQPFAEYHQYLQIHSQISERDKALIQERKDAVRVVFMTSSASRGLSFTQTRHIFVEVPRFNIEANLMEIMQVVYRGRGGDDNVDKALTFYLADPAYYRPDDAEWSLKQSVMHLLNMLILLRLCLETRIRGAGAIRDDHYMVVPVGGKSMSRAGGSLHHEMGDLLQQLERECQRRRQNTTLRQVRDAVAHTFEAMVAILEPAAGVSSLLSLLHDNTPANLLTLLDRGCARLLEGLPLEGGMVSGEMLLVPVEGQMAVSHVAEFGRTLGRWITPDLRNKLWALIYDVDEYPRALLSGLRSFVDLVQQFLPAESTQQLTRMEQRTDLFYAVPLLAYVVGDVLAGSWDADCEEGSPSLRGLLRGHVQSSYPSEHYLPMAGHYRDIPFVLFSSTELRSLRQRMFSGRFMFMSHELNVLDMLLAHGE